MKLMFRQSGDTYRVWRPTWYGDQFEVFNIEDFTLLQQFCLRLGIDLIKAED